MEGFVLGNRNSQVLLNVGVFSDNQHFFKLKIVYVIVKTHTHVVSKVLVGAIFNKALPICDKAKVFHPEYFFLTLCINMESN